jgi:hypothetical protein
MTDAVAATAVRIACVIEGRFLSSQGAQSFINESSSLPVHISKITIDADTLHSRFLQILYLERGRANHLASGKGKSYACAMAAVCLLLMLLPMKTNTSPTFPGEVQPYVQLQHEIHGACARNIPSGSSRMASVLCARLTNRALPNCSVFLLRANTGSLPNQRNNSDRRNHAPSQGRNDIHGEIKLQGFS